MRKATMFIIICVICTTLAACTSPIKQASENTSTAQSSMPKTNIDNTMINLYEGMDNAGSSIIYGDSSEEIIGKDFVGLFINGSIIKNAGLVHDSDKIWVPINIVAENLNAKCDLDSKAGSITIVDGENTIELFADSSKAKINKKTRDLDAAPKSLNNSIYIPINLVTEVFNANVEYFDGTNTTKPHIVERLPHVMISRYPSDVKKLSKEEAVQIAKDQLILAFEKKFGKFVPLDEKEKVNKNEDKDMLRDAITNLNVTSENDRYYILPVMYDFWVDKYTGDVYTFYNGLSMQIKLFDPNDKNALAFPG